MKDPSTTGGKKKKCNGGGGGSSSSKTSATKKKAHDAVHRLQQNIHQQANHLRDVQHDLKDAISESPLSLYAVSHLEKLSQKKGANTAEERFKVTPSYAYPGARMNREELRNEMNLKSSYFHSLDLPPTHQDQSTSRSEAVGTLYLEILQCFGLPKTELLGEASAFCVAVLGGCAFKTDVMPPVANPMWLCKMRRAARFPVMHAYARLFVGVFGKQDGSNDRADGFAGRVVVDVARLRPGCTYGVTLPLRQSAHVYCRQRRGAIRLRVHLEWQDERQALLSYVPRSLPTKPAPNESTTIACCDAKSFQNTARVVYGSHMPGRFTMRQLKATVREINFTRVHILRYIRKREVYNLSTWQYPLISGFVFVAWMHSVYKRSLAYLPGHVLTLLWLYLLKNYVAYGVESPVVKNGFLPPTWEELWLALLFGSSIEPLEMERKNEAEAKSALQDMNVTTTSTTPLQTIDESTALLKEIAEAFRNSVKVKDMRYRFRVYRNVFRGNDAVTYLVEAGYARTRPEAVTLGGRLMTELHLFEHCHNHHSFKDEALYYIFVASDSNEYTFTTHRPRGTWLFRILGLMPEPQLHPSAAAKAHIEMPFADGVDHPRFTVRESLVIRSKQSQRLLEQENSMMEETASTSQTTFENNLDALLDEDESDDQSVTADESEAFSLEDPGAIVEVKLLKKPPQQDIDVIIKGDKKIVDVLAETRHEMHGLTFHLFNDRVYKICDPVQNDDADSEQNTSKSSTGGSKRSPKGATSRRQFTRKEPSRRTKDRMKHSRKDEYDRLLAINKYSHGNPWLAKVGIIVQPIIEIALEWLCLVRALFNVFTWRDPILSFWISIVLPVIIVILHLFPWRLVLAVVGLALFGPQNWVLRVMRERRPGYEPPDFDKIIKTKKPATSDDSEDGGDHQKDEDALLFSNFAPDNRQLCNQDFDGSNVRKVVVPYSQLMYQRFYDWPPENEYARVVAEDPPQCDISNEFRSMRSSGSSSFDESSVNVEDRRPGRAKRRAKKILAGMPLIRSRRKNVSTY